jgi:invasion protein IalB
MSPRPYQFRSGSKLLAALLILLLPVGSGAIYADEIAKPSGSAADTAAGRELASRGERAAREIKYSDWRKFCFKTPGSKAVCRTTLAGAFQTGQSAVRIDLIERDGDKAARLQLFLPVGLYLQAGVKLKVDQGSSYRIPYVWCLTNTCIAADLVDPRLLEEMQSGKTLLLEVLDSSLIAVSTSLPLEQFVTARQGTPARTFEQGVDE